MRALNFDGTYEEDLERFLHLNQPSITPHTDGPWITVRGRSGPAHGQTPPTMQPSALQVLYNAKIAYCEAQCVLYPRCKSGIRQEAKEEIIELARTYNDVAGKWVLFPFSTRVDEVWNRIARATVRGDLGTAAKVTTRLADGSRVHALCVYVRSFADVNDVTRVLRALQSLGIVKRWKEDPDETRMDCNFKPDVFTRLGFYHRGGRDDNVKINPVLYKIEDIPYPVPPPHHQQQ